MRKDKPSEADCHISSAPDALASKLDLAPGPPNPPWGRGGCRGFTGPVPQPLSIRLVRKIAVWRHRVKSFPRHLSAGDRVKSGFPPATSQHRQGSPMPRVLVKIGVLKPSKPRSSLFQRGPFAKLLWPPFQRGADRQLADGAGNVPIGCAKSADAFQDVHLIGDARAVQTVRQWLLAV
jgi:hypothetical protein